MKKNKNFLLIALMFLFVQAKAQSVKDYVGVWTLNMGVDRLLTEEAKQLHSVSLELNADGTTNLWVDDVSYNAVKYTLNVSTNPQQVDFITNRPPDVNNPNGGGIIAGIIKISSYNKQGNIGETIDIQWDPNLGTNRPSAFTNFYTLQRKH